MDEKLQQIQKLLDVAEGNLHSAREMIREMTGATGEPLNLEDKLENLNVSEEGKVIEGVFNGEVMVAPDAKTYPVPPNYASKSKLVEGDTLKLTIADDGSFVYKQIAPVERRNAIGTLGQSDGNYTVSAEGKSYRVLTASVTFYKAEPGDQVTILLPRDHESNWAVLENVIKKAETEVATNPEAEPEIDIPEPPMPQIPIEPATPPVQPIPTVDEALAQQEEPVKEIPDGPQIEFPGGASQVSDEELLRNLKENLKNIQQPQYAPPADPTKPVDNIVANDLQQFASQNQPAEISVKPAEDKPIQELDI